MAIHLFSLGLTSLLLANVVIMANASASAIANGIVNACLKDYEKGCHKNADCCSGQCYAEYRSSAYCRPTSTTTTPPPCKKDGQPCRSTEECCGDECFFQYRTTIGRCQTIPVRTTTTKPTTTTVEPPKCLEDKDICMKSEQCCSGLCAIYSKGDSHGHCAHKMATLENGQSEMN